MCRFLCYIHQVGMCRFLCCSVPNSPMFPQGNSTHRRQGFLPDKNTVSQRQEMSLTWTVKLSEN